MKPDRFDILVMITALVLAAAAIVLGANGGGGDAHSRPIPAARVKAEPPDPTVYQEIAAAGTLLDSERPAEAVEELRRISAANPAMSEPHALMGQAYARMLDYPASLREFRTALLMDPDYADKKSRKFIGKRIKAAMKDGMAEAKSRLASDPDDAAARAALKDAYYLERMMAGGCE